MEMMAHNPEKAHSAHNISPEQAKEYVSHNTGKMSYKNLPEKKRFQKLHEYMYNKKKG